MLAAVFWVLVLAALVVWVSNSFPWIWLIAAAAIVVAIWINQRKKRRNQIDSISAFLMQAQALDEFANKVEKGTTDSEVSFALKSGEILLGSQEGVGLLEWVSTGSTYSGGSQGFSFRVMRGVYYRVGGSRGQIVKNPPSLTTSDVGTVNYTTQRVTFVGPSQTRQWEVAKILDLDIDHNGQTVMISVSNRQKPSGLQGGSFSQVGPGFYLQAALQINNSGANAAAEKLRDYANQLRQIAEQTRVSLKLPETSTSQS